MKLFFSNQKFSMKRDTPSVIKIKAWLDKQKKGELFDRVQVSLATNIATRTMKEFPHMLVGYCYKHKTKMYYANKATITAFKREIEKHDNG